MQYKRQLYDVQTATYYDVDSEYKAIPPAFDFDDGDVIYSTISGIYFGEEQDYLNSAKRIFGESIGADFFSEKEGTQSLKYKKCIVFRVGLTMEAEYTDQSFDFSEDPYFEIIGIGEKKDTFKIDECTMAGRGQIYWTTADDRYGWDRYEYPYTPNRIVEYLLRRYTNYRNIDIEAFNIVPQQPSIGVVYKKPIDLIEVLNSMCSYGSMCVYSKKNGQISAKNWIYDVDDYLTFNESNIIKDSVKIKTSPIEYLYNEFTLYFGYSERDDSYLYSITINNVDQDNAVLGISYSGFEPTSSQSNTMYVVWEKCRQSYLKYGVKNAMPKEMGETFIFGEDTNDCVNSSLYLLYFYSNWFAYLHTIIDLDIHFWGSDVELMQYCNFTDPAGNLSGMLKGWITNIETDPSNDLTSLQITCKDDAVVVETNYRLTEDGNIRITENSERRILE